MKQSLAEMAEDRCNSFQNKALEDVTKLAVARRYLASCITNSTPVSLEIRDGSTQECKDIYILDVCVLSVLNYHTFPVTPVLDSIQLSQQGKLNDALDVRPFMFSGPAPTMAIWSGTNQESIPNYGYPSLTDEDAKAAFNHWLSYIFGLKLTESSMLESA